jgi:UTP--glucose-1-phosphate uridylyltransferase
MTIRTVIIPAAGKGTRLLPATKVTAKELLPVYDKVAIDFAVEEAVSAGAERIIVVITASKTAIRDYLGEDRTSVGRDVPDAWTGLQPQGPQLLYVFQDQALGLGHAILCCKGMTLPGPFAVILPDDIIMGRNCLADMAVHYDGGHMIAAMQVKPDETSQYGIFRVSGLPKDRCLPVSGMVEKPAPGKAPSCFAAVGRYILDPMIFEVLAHTAIGRGGELQLTDAIAIATNAMPVVAFQFLGARYDCGNHDGLLAASNARQADLRRESSTRMSGLPLSATASGATRAMVNALDPTAGPVEIAACGH